MAKPITLASLLLMTSALVAPAAIAQTVPAEEPGPATPEATDATPMADDAMATDAAAAEAQAEEPVDVSIPGGDIVVVGRRGANIQQTAPQVVSVLSTAEIKRTGEGDIAGSLQRVTGLSVVGGGFVYVRGLGDRYSLALLNGSPLPSPEPLKRVVPLDLFPTSVIASTLVQKSYSANFPGEFGGGVINLTTRSIPTEGFFSISGGISGDTETTNNLGYTYYGSDTDWTGFDDGTRDITAPLAAAFASGKPILEGADFTREQLQDISTSLVNAPTTIVQQNNNIPVNWSGSFSGGKSWDIGDTRLGFIATASISNKWRTRETLQQVAGAQDLSIAARDFTRVVTDNRIVVNGLLGLGAEFGEHKVRWTNLYIRDTLKQARLGLGTNIDNGLGEFDVMQQNTAWFERQLINTQAVGEFRFNDVSLDLRGSYANSQREAPYERSFTYVRSNLAGDVTGDRFVNDLAGPLQGDASIAFSDLNEDLYAGSADLNYKVHPDLSFGIGYSYSDTKRASSRREFRYQAPDGGLPKGLGILRPDYLVSDAVIRQFDIGFFETTAQQGVANFDAGLRVHGVYGQVRWAPVDGLSIDAGVRWEDGLQTVQSIDLDGTPVTDPRFNTELNNAYWLPAITATYDIAPQMQLRVNASKTIARPQFRELIAQIYFDPESNRLFRGNASLIDSELWNGEARFEWYFARDQRFTLAGFYKRIDNPIEAFTSNSGNDLNTSFANAPQATLYGAEVEVQKYFPLGETLGGDFFASRRVVANANYTFTKSKLSVAAGDTTSVNGAVQAAADFFIDGTPLTGQSDHIVNFQIGLEDEDKLSQQTILLTYASPRVTTRGPAGQPDVQERPGLRLDFVARQGVTLFGIDSELKLEARNITGRRYVESQRANGNEIFYNLYDVGTTLSASLSVNF